MNKHKYLSEEILGIKKDENGELATMERTIVYKRAGAYTLRSTQYLNNQKFLM